jgi:hypothetical protein
LPSGLPSGQRRACGGVKTRRWPRSVPAVPLKAVESLVGLPHMVARGREAIREVLSGRHEAAARAGAAVVHRCAPIRSCVPWQVKRVRREDQLRSKQDAPHQVRHRDNTAPASAVRGAEGVTCRQAHLSLKRDTARHSLATDLASVSVSGVMPRACPNAAPTDCASSPQRSRRKAARPLTN